MALQYLADNNGWLSFKHSTPILYITSEDDEFDMTTMHAWRDEGFMVKYVPMGKGGKGYVQTLYKLGDACGIGERYAIVGKQPLYSYKYPRYCSKTQTLLTVYLQLSATQPPFASRYFLSPRRQHRSSVP